MNLGWRIFHWIKNLAHKIMTWLWIARIHVKQDTIVPVSNSAIPRGDGIKKRKTFHKLIGQLPKHMQETLSDKMQVRTSTEFVICSPHVCCGSQGIQRLYKQTHTCTHMHVLKERQRLRKRDQETEEERESGKLVYSKHQKTR